MTRQGGVVSRDYRLVPVRQAAEERPEPSRLGSVALAAEVARVDQHVTIGMLVSRSRPWVSLRRTGRTSKYSPDSASAPESTADALVNHTWRIP